MTEINVIHYFSFREHSVFMPLRYLYPECYVLRKEHPRTNPLQCFYTECPGNRGCPEILAKKVWYLFDNVLPDAKVLFAYFKNNTGSICAGVFDRDMKEPKVIVCNRSAFDKFQKEGIAYQWTPTSEFNLLSSNRDILIPESALLHKI